MSSEPYTVTVAKDLEDLIPGFMRNRRKEVEVLREALGRSDFEQLRQLGHRMKGVGNSYGFPQISAFGARIETDAKSREVSGLQAVIGEYAQFIENVTVVFN